MTYLAIDTEAAEALAAELAASVSDFDDIVATVMAAETLSEISTGTIAALSEIAQCHSSVGRHVLSAANAVAAYRLTVDVITGGGVAAPATLEGAINLIHHQLTKDLPAGAGSHLGRAGVEAIRIGVLDYATTHGLTPTEAAREIAATLAANPDVATEFRDTYALPPVEESGVGSLVDDGVLYALGAIGITAFAATQLVDKNTELTYPDFSGLADLITGPGEVRPTGPLPLVPTPTNPTPDSGLDGYQTPHIPQLDGLHLAPGQDAIWSPGREKHVLPGDGTGGWHYDITNVPAGRTVLSKERINTGRLTGVVIAQVETCVNGRCRVETKTFFPDHWTKARVIQAINEAYHGEYKSGTLRVGRNDGATSTGFPVTFFIDNDGGIITALPNVASQRTDG